MCQKPSSSPKAASPVSTGPLLQQHLVAGDWEGSFLPPSVPAASQLGDPDSAGPARQAAEQTDARPPGGDPSLSGVGVGGLHQTRL